MENNKRQLVLGAYLAYGTGHHPAAWRHPDVNARAALDIDHYLNMARTAEKGLLDLIFLSDTPSVFQDDQLGYGSRVVVFEPMTLLSALAMVTQHIGLVATASTTYKHPFNIAREFASLDHISHGRAGWNLVTSSKSHAAKNFGFAKHPEHDERYRQAAESWEIVTGLWDSWDDDALPRDKQSGIFYVPSKCHELNFQGKYFSVKGPLNISRPPQGHPIIVQAGSSEPGKELAARTAELVFTAQPDIDSAKAFYRDLKSRLHKYDRDYNDILIMPGLCFFIGPDEESAKEKFNNFRKLIHPKFGLSMLSDLLGGIDLSAYDINQPLPDIPASNGNQSRRAIIEKMSKSESLTIKQLYEKIIISRGHLVFVGSYQQVATQISQWLHENACDGFNLMPPSMPGCLDEFITSVVPELQKLNIFKTKYKDGTLREKLNIPKPASRFHV
ncbi:LLM class flavin-dependent oxidoreductase [Xenorhabdus cabanillasii]|uniref:Monooxygenase yxeK n=1 Tax=Xenorhabdus cabanillasii JM26 TaxID=1427517 RepID=W1IPH0_9GAMM|nr:LLM class flavin-dependent oxidoreductase [Xenorhabdus cabanillasii]PHM75489.1 nitrilotriacetate monooxygenase [Xenorhabdus cabanillasii JM26]CDL80334.1 putative monooxygenase yxeK [Xenorhabdus cabanillasii JM26]